MARARKADVASAVIEAAPELDDDEDVRRRIASGELVRHVSHGAPPVRDHIVAQLRAQVSAPRPSASQRAEHGGAVADRPKRGR